MGLWNGFDISEFQRNGKMQDDIIIASLDFGHGQCSASFLSGTIIKDLVLNDNEDEVIPTAILYENNSVKIGCQAGGKEGCILYFKDRPVKFNDKILGKTKKKLMQDFLQKLIAQIVEQNDVINKNTKLLLLVGCPSDEKDWLSRKFEYACMIEEAMKKEVPNIKVVIQAESRAAFYNAITKDGHSLSLDRGILVLDFGSSTADYTWMQTGKKPLEGSWRLGASEVESLMLDTALLDSQDGNRYDTTELDEKEIDKYTWTMKLAKEQYYNDENTPSILINIYERDDSGKKIRYVNKRGKEIDKVRERISADIDDSFMDQVMKEPFTLQGKARGEAGWKEHCRAFVREIAVTMKERGFPCEAVILTGGASKMNFIEKICKEEFRKIGIREDCIKRSVKPSLSVSRGLIAAAQRDIAAAIEQKSLLDSLIPIINIQIDQFVKDVSEKVARNCEKSTLTVMEKWANDEQTPVGKRSRNELKKMLENELDVSCGKIKVQKMISDCYEDMMQRSRVEIQKAVNEKVSGIYGNRLDKDTYHLNDTQWKKIMENCNINNLKSSINVGYLSRGGMKEFAEDLAWLGSGILDLVGMGLNGIFGWNLKENRNEEKRKHLNGDDLSKQDRIAICSVQKKNYYSQIYPKIYSEFRQEVMKNREQDKNSIEKLIVDALEEAFDIIAYYG